MQAVHNKTTDTFSINLSAEELNAVLCAFDELEKKNYARIEGHEKSEFAIGAKKLHEELSNLYSE